MNKTTTSMTIIPYGTIITQLLDGNVNKRDQIRKSSTNSPTSDRHWYEGFCTIRVGGGRQTGRTTAAIGCIDKHTAWISHNLLQCEVDVELILQLRPKLALPAMFTMSAIDRTMRKDSDLLKQIHFELNPTFTRYIADNATLGFNYCSRRKFYDFVEATTAIKDPEIILIS